MIQALGSDNKSVEAVKASLNLEITEVTLSDETLTFTFKDRSALTLNDGGQSCCESRYFTSDDDLSSFVGGEILNIESVDVDAADEEDQDYGVHDQTFLKIQTSKGPMTVTAHVEHNGYYGGFWIVASRYEPPKE
jgi:hypothetical protein